MTDSPAGAATIRIDKWLWHARFFKTRSLAAKVVSDRKVRVDGQPISKPSRTIGPGATLTFPQGSAIRVVRVEACGARRGPAPEAQTLYTDLDPPKPRSEEAPDEASVRSGPRPTKRERRSLEQTRRAHLE
ncbi:MAG: RNA-binding S4 domain-containing protein [Pseudomonadota bacterium]